MDREVESKNILALAKCQKLAGVIPRYFLYILRGRNILSPKEKFNLPGGTMVMEYIEGKDINGKDLEKPKVRNTLLKSLHTFHTSGVKFANIYDVFRDEVAKYQKKAKKYPIERLLKKKKLKR